MDRIAKFQEVLVSVLRDYQPRFVNDTGTEVQVVADTTSNYYQLFRHGWTHDDQFLHYAIFSLRIRDGKIWLLDNRSDVDITEDLMAKGVRREEIVLGFIPEGERVATGFGVG